MTRVLAGLPAPATPVGIAHSIIDVWQHYHRIADPANRYGSRCDCLMNCPDMPAAIRALDEATQRYYEEHHNLPVPDCFGWDDQEFNASLVPLIQRSAG